MKIKPEHYETLRLAITSIPQEQITAHKKKLESDPSVKDLDKRLRWDMMHAVMPAAWVCDNLYPYMNDTHLDTALRAIVDSEVPNDSTST